MKASASAVFADLDTTTQVLSSFQYRTVPCYNSLGIHLGLLAEYTSLGLEQFDQTHQVLSLSPFQNYCTMQTLQRQKPDLDKTPKGLSLSAK
jgi:hypothetical protein